MTRYTCKHGHDLDSDSVYSHLAPRYIESSRQMDLVFIKQLGLPARPTFAS